MSFNNCLDNVVHNWVLGLPENPEGRSIYFVLAGNNVVQMYVTDGQGVPYLVSGGGGGSEPINLTSPNGTISIIDGTQIDIDSEILQSIISLHNLFPDLQGGLLNEYYHLDEAKYTYVSEMVSENKLGNLYDLINLLATHPIYILPSSSLSLASATFEVGSSVSISITQTYTQNDGGNKQSEQILKNNTVVSNSNTFSENIVVPLGTIVYSGKVNYVQGACKNNNLNALDCTGRVEFGQTLSPDKIITGGLRRFAGNLATLPTTGDEVRSSLLGTSVVNTSNTFSFTTGTTDSRFVIAIPSAKNLVSVINTGTNENLTFILSSITTIPDAAGTDQSYKVYTLENAVPFSTNYTINVTLN